jgi:hypothetical protein
MDDHTSAAEASKYEQQALREIRAWKSPELGALGRAMQLVNKPINAAGEALMNTPGLGQVIEKSASGVVGVANDLAHWTVRPGAIHQEYRKAGHTQIMGPSDIGQLDLGEVDRVIGWLAAKYKGIALLEGGTTGAAGLAGLIVDIPALVTLNLRAIGEYATYCGFDVSTQQERLFAMNVLSLASSPSDSSKTLALAQLLRISQDVAQRRVWKNLEQRAFVALLQRLAKALGIRLTRAKLAQGVPIVGGVVGAGFNAYFTAKVCDAAYFLYRERFLTEKYGADSVAGIGV